MTRVLTVTIEDDDPAGPVLSPRAIVQEYGPDGRVLVIRLTDTARVTMRGDRPKAPRTAELTGSCPGITEGMSTEDYIGSLRDTEQP